MADHDESLIDKVKNALGMGDESHDHAEHDHADHADHDQAAHAGGSDDTDARADGWAGVPEALSDDGPETQGTLDPSGSTGRYGADDEGGLGRNPGPVGSAGYEGGATPNDLGGTDATLEGEGGGLDTTREDASSTEFGGAYGGDETAMPTSGAWDRGEAPPGEASFGSEEKIDMDRRDGDA